MKPRYAVAAILILAAIWSPTRRFICDTEAIRRQVHNRLPDYELSRVDLVPRGGDVTTLLFTPRDGIGAVVIALRTEGSKLFTASMGLNSDAAVVAKIAQEVASWDADPAMQRTLGLCSLRLPFPTLDDPPARLRRVLADIETRGVPHIGEVARSWIDAAAFAIGAVILLLPRGWRTRATLCVLIVAAALPLLSLLIQSVGADWFPMLDDSLIELRTRDVGTLDTPLLGPYSSRGWNHPGPLIFWLYAIPYRLFGGASWGLMVGATMINALAVTGTLLIAWRKGGILLSSCLALGLATLLAALHADFAWIARDP